MWSSLLLILFCGCQYTSCCCHRHPYPMLTIKWQLIKCLRSLIHFFKKWMGLEECHIQVSPLRDSIKPFLCISVSTLITILVLVFRQKIKCVFNKQFGSVFRTYHNPTYFSRRLFRFADIYTSCVTNLLNYSVNHTFYPRRGVMPHEYTSYFVWILNDL
jgi:hypothetical protein